jgi:hypothetical protein
MRSLCVAALLAALPVHAADPAPGTKEDYERRVNKQIDGLEKDLAELRRKAEHQEAQARRDLDQLLRDADHKGKDAHKKMDELTKASGEAWHDLEKGVSKAVDDFADGVDRARKSK